MGPLQNTQCRINTSECRCAACRPGGATFVSLRKNIIQLKCKSVGFTAITYSTSITITTVNTVHFYTTSEGPISMPECARVPECCEHTISKNTEPLENGSPNVGARSVPNEILFMQLSLSKRSKRNSIRAESNERFGLRQYLQTIHLRVSNGAIFGPQDFKYMARSF